MTTITGSLENELGAPHAHLMLSAIPANAAHAIIDGSNVKLGGFVYEGTAIPSPMTVDPGVWVFTASATRKHSTTSRNVSVDLFPTVEFRVDLSEVDTISWAEIFAGGAAFQPVTPTEVQQAIAARDEAVAAAAAAEAVGNTNDTIMTALVPTSSGSAFSEALSNTIGAGVIEGVQPFFTPQTPTLNALATTSRGKMPRVVTLLTGSNDEVLSATNCTLSTDTVNKRWERGTKMVNNGAGGFSVMRFGLNNPGLSGVGARVLPPWQALVLDINVPDPTKFAAVQVTFYGAADLGSSTRWIWANNTAGATHTLTAGDNFIRVPPHIGSYIPTELHRIEVQFALSASEIATPTGATATVKGLWLECPEKARFIHTWDRGYLTAWDTIYADMKARGWPVTLAVDCTRFGDNAGTIGEAISYAQAVQFAGENGNSVSFHGWDGQPTSAMTVDQLRADTAKSIKYLQEHFPDSMGRFWRAAYVQGSAAQWEAMKPYLLAAASAGTAPLGPTMWPPRDLHQIPRWSLDNYKLDSNITDMFALMQKTRMTLNTFVHGYDETTPGYDTSAAKWELYRGLLDQAVADGWAECVTFEQLFLESGGTFRTIGGATVAEYTDAQGNRVTKTLL